MLLEDQHATTGYNSHRNYQNLSARSPDTIDEVRHAAGPNLPKNRLFFAVSISMYRCDMAAHPRRISSSSVHKLRKYCRNLGSWMLS